MIQLNTYIADLKQKLEALSKETDNVMPLLQSRKENQLKKAKVIKDNQSQPTVKFIIGGEKFETFESTIRKYPSSLIGGIIQSEYYTSDPSKPIVIDRNPHHFHHILDYYRYDDDINLSYITNKEIINEMLIEAQYYELIPLIHKLERLSL